MKPQLDFLLPMVGAVAITCLGCDGFADTGAASDGTSGGDNADWIVNDLQVGQDSLHYVVVGGTVTLNTSMAGYGTLAEARFYSDDYKTLITDTSSLVGTDLDEEGTTQEFELSHYKVWILPSLDGYSHVCVEFRADDTQYPDWAQIGCIDGAS